MRILFVTTTFPRPRSLKTFPWAVDRARNLRDAGADVGVLNLRGSLRGRVEPLTPDHVRLLGLDGIWIQSIGWPLLSSMPGCRSVFDHLPEALLWPAYRGARGRILKAVQAFGPDVILSNVPNAAGYVAYQLRRDTRGQRIASVVLIEDLLLFERCDRNPFTRSMARRVLRSADDVVAVADVVARRAAECVPGINVHVLRNGVPLPPAMPDDHGPGEQDDRRTFFCACDFTGRKQQPRLIRAFAAAVAEVARIDPARAAGARLRLAGEGPELGQCQATVRELGIADRVDLLGRIDRGSVFAEIGRSDAVVLPSYAEPLATILIEGMACGRPIVWGRDGGINELARDGADGIAVDPHDEHSTAAALRTLILAPREALQRMGAAGRATYDRNCRPDVAGKKLLDVLSGAAAKRSDGR